jgi:hypothetical protein
MRRLLLLIIGFGLLFVGGFLTQIGFLGFIGLIVCFIGLMFIFGFFKSF